MTKRSKILAVLLSVCLIFGVIAVLFASAENAGNTAAAANTHKTAEREGKFLYYNADDDTYTLCDNGTFKTKVNTMDRGDAIKLLSDLNFVVDKNNTTDTYAATTVVPSTYGETGSGSLYIDLNGFQLSMEHIHWAIEDYGQRGAGHGLLIAPKSNTTLCVYSSDVNHIATMRAVHHLEDHSEKDKAGAIFGISGSGATNAHIYLGDVESAKVLSYSEIDENDNVVGGSFATEKCDGDYLNTYSPTLFSSEKGSGSAIPFTGCSFNVGGGNHYQVTDAILASLPMFNIYCDADIIATGANFFSTIGSSIINFSRYGTLLEGNQYYNAPADANVTMTDCTLYTTGTVISNLYESDKSVDYNTQESHVKLTNCDLIGSTVHTILKGTPEYIDCNFSVATSGYENEETLKMVRTNVSKTLNLYTADKELDENSDWTGYWDIKKLEEKTVNLAYTAASNGEYVDISWISQDNVVTEKWVVSDSIYPVPAFSAASSDVYTYDYSPKIVPTSKSGACSYELTPITKFAIQANVSLHSSFTFNLYVPENVGDSETITGKWIANANGEKISDVTFDSAKTLNISGINHYVVSQDIFASNGDAEYSFVLEMKGAFGETITKKLDFSIFDYADRVSKANVSNSAKALVAATKTYIKTAMNYFETGDTLPYPVESNTDITDVAGRAEASENTSANDAAKAVLKGATLSPQEQIYFLFTFKDGASGNVTFTYSENLKSKSVTVDVTNLDSYLIPVKAIDLRKNIYVDVNNDKVNDYTFCLANYVYFIENDKNYQSNETLHALTDAMWAYSEAAYAYLTGDSYDTPTVELKIADKNVTAENYVIVAGDDEKIAAEALQAAIESKIGQRIEIASASVDGKNSIFVDVTAPTNAYDFNVKVDGCDLVINCSFKSFINDGMSAFISEHINTLNKSYNFASDFVDNYYTDRIYYSDFGVPTTDKDFDITKLPSLVDDGTITIDNASIRDNLKYGEALKVLEANGEITNALDALIEVHNFANNAARYTVYADEGATYYINAKYVTATNHVVIKTNVNWGDANIIINDYELTQGTGDGLDGKGLDVFVVKSQYTEKIITDEEELANILGTGFSPDTKQVNYAPGYRAMIIPVNSSDKIFRRKGSTYKYRNSAEGQPMSELVVIDKDGNVDPNTPFIFTYNKLDSITVYNIDLAPLTVTGGNATTVVSGHISESGRSINIDHGFQVQRSNTRVENLNHVIVGEYAKGVLVGGLYYKDGKPLQNLDTFAGATYDGFFCAQYASDITFYNCKLQARRIYSVGDSSYEIDADFANNCVFDTCEQTNFYVNPETYLVDSDSTKNTMLCMGTSYPGYTDDSGVEINYNIEPCWGTMGGNNIKNFHYKNSRISRFDAHEGIYNGSVVNCDIYAIALSGWGEFKVENTNVYKADVIVPLRSDYGYTWNGKIILKNVDARYTEGTTPTVVQAKYTNWDFGYECAFPSVEIDGLEFYSELKTKDLTNPTKEVNDTNKLVKKLTINMYSHDFNTEPNPHGDTAATVAITPYAIEDLNNDGIMDGSLALFDGDTTKKIKATVLKSGATSRTVRSDYSVGTSSSGAEGILMSEFDGVNIECGFWLYDETKPNLNKTKAPDSIVVLNNAQGYDYEIYLKKAFGSYVYDGALAYKTFFAGTAIAIDKNNNGTIESGEYLNGSHVHTEVTIPAVAATCTTAGSTEGKMCSSCNKILVEPSVIPATGHTVITNGYVAPTCTTTGLTEGKSCFVCKEVIDEQKIINALGHEEVDISGQDPTCTEPGFGSGKQCSRCGVITVTQDTIPATSHTEVIDAAVDATCTETGLTEGSHCLVCNEVIVQQKTVDALGHKGEEIPGKAATCTESGYSAGTKCSRCGVITDAQDLIEALGHDYKASVTEPTCTEKGYTTHTCERCDDSYTDTYVDALGHNYGDNDVCTECGKENPVKLKEEDSPLIPYN